MCPNPKSNTSTSWAVSQFPLNVGNPKKKTDLCGKEMRGVIQIDEDMSTDQDWPRTMSGENLEDRKMCGKVPFVEVVETNQTQGQTRKEPHCFFGPS